MIAQTEQAEQCQELTHEESIHLKKLVTGAFPYHDKRGQDSLYKLYKTLIQENPSIAEELRYSLAERRHFNRPIQSFRKRIRTYRKVFLETKGHFGTIMRNLAVEVQNAK